MTRALAIIYAHALYASLAVAFTNGSLVPAYLCNPVNDGLPKTFGQVLQFTKANAPQIAFSNNAQQNAAAPAPGAAGGNRTQVPNSAYILASLHDSPNRLDVIGNSLQVGVNGGSVVAGLIVAGRPNVLHIRTTDNSQLKGAVLLGQDQTGTRQGSFTDAAGGPFIPFPGCGLNPQGQVSGVIQQTGVSATNSYNNLVYNAPACVPGNNLTMAGLSVTSNGFGVWTANFAVLGSNCAAGAGAGNLTLPGLNVSVTAGNGNNATAGGGKAKKKSSKEPKAAASLPLFRFRHRSQR